MTLSDKIVRLLPSATTQWGALDLTVSGHSLGGGLASAAAVWTGLNGSTFNASGLHKETIRNQAEDELQNDRPYRFDALTRFGGSANGGTGIFIAAFHDSLDILTTIQTSGAPVPRAFGLPVTMAGPYHFDQDATTAYSNVQWTVRSVLQDRNGDGIAEVQANWESIIMSLTDGLFGTADYTKLASSHSYYQSDLLGDLYGAWLLDNGAPDDKAPPVEKQ